MKTAWSAQVTEGAAGQLGPRSGRRPRDVAFAVAFGALLTGYNNLAGRTAWHRRWYPAVNTAAAAAAVSAALADGLRPDDLGLGRDWLAAGLQLGAAAAVPVAIAFVLAPVTPAAPLLGDQRVAGLSGRQLAYQVLVRIPVGTVGWEEIAFRGVLHGALRRVMGERAAIVAGGVVFAAWHVRPAAQTLSANRLAAGRTARIAAVGAVAAGTGIAGALLSWLRERSGSLAAPVLLHLIANCAGPLASAASERRQRRGAAAASGGRRGPRVTPSCVQ
jgi:membrane protease YdiL (CAAX protease family)